MTTRRALFDRIVAAALVVVAASQASACRKKEIPPEEPSYPATVGDESDAELAARHHADDAFTLLQPDGSYRVLSFKLPKASEADSDYCVVVYRRQGDRYVRHGAENNLVAFERPRMVEGPPPRIETSALRLGVRYHIAIDAKGAELVPSEGVMDGGWLMGHPR